MNRRERRQYMKYAKVFKNKKHQSTKEWMNTTSDNIVNGRLLEAHYFETTQKSVTEQLKKHEAALVESLKESGIPKKEQDDIVEAWLDRNFWPRTK